MKKTLIVLMLFFVCLEANALKSEESPYLQQHADNPVDWMPWSKAAFQKAKKEHKLIFLSIGYSTCHWCHVMEHESFENKKFAKFLNRYFVPIKVDREEMPQIDRYYQKIYQIMNGRGGGWPLTIIMTADKKPFFAGTYIPLNPRYGSAGLWDIVKQIVTLKKKHPQKIADIARSVERAMQELESAQLPPVKKSGIEIAKAFVEGVSKRFDYKNGGIGRAPKFPHAATIRTLLDIYLLNGNKKALEMATAMLDHMANGGIYDQIEGGFYRYSTDAAWKIPHFEKMLYTNAELLEAYAKAYKITHKKRYKEVINETAAFLKKYYYYEGLYYGASDADTLTPKGEKEEGYYYLYSYKEARDALKQAKIKEPEKILDALGISWEGNFHKGLSNPRRDITVNADPQELQRAKEALRALRKKRKYPFIDKKILLSWNALLAHSFFIAGKTKDAEEIVDNLIQKLYKNGKLYHQILPGKKPKVAAVMEDYAFLIAALIESYEYRYKQHDLDLAKELFQKAIKEFYKGGVWYSSRGELASKAEIGDGAYRNALAVMGENLLRLGVLSSDINYTEDAKKLFQSIQNEIMSYPAANATGVDFALALKQGYIVIKAKRDSLQKIKKVLAKKSGYPYLLYKESTEETLLACKSDRCFAYAKSTEEIIQKVIKEIENQLSKKEAYGKRRFFTPKRE